MPASPRLLLVGCGKMGGALLQAIHAAHITSRLAVVDPAPPPAHIKPSPELVWANDPTGLDPFLNPDIIILAVKPQHMAAILPLYARFRKAVFVSIAAGVTLAALEKQMGGAGCAIIRAMPNLPASIGEGVTVAVANAYVTADQVALSDILLQTVGEVAWVEDETMLDAVTALSGSGPAYVFALCEAMTAAGVALGLPPHLASQLARRTLSGSGAMLAQVATEAGDLRRAVTSPGGTTEAALAHLLDAEKGLSVLMGRAMQAAAARATELAGIIKT